LAVHDDEPYLVLSVAEDATVFAMDIREERHQKLLTLKDANDDRVALYGVASHPFKNQEFCLSGCDAYVRIFDRRYLMDSDSCLKKFIPQHLVSSF
jgi:hypothetical protein